MQRIFTRRGAEAPYHLLLEAMNEGALTLDKDGATAYCNRRFARMLQRPKGRIIAHPFRKWLSAEDHAVFQKLLRKARKGGARGEFTLQAGAGRTLPVVISARAFRLAGTERFSVLVADITERKGSEQTLREANEQLEARVEHRTAELAEVNENLREHAEELASANQDLQVQADELHIQTGQLAAANRQTAVLNEQLSAANARLEGLYAELQTLSKELEHRVEDRTAKLQELVGDLEHFSYTITHDMRAPLRAMTGFGQLLVEDCAHCMGTEQKKCIQRIVEAARRMDALITDALQYTRAVRQELGLTPVNALALLRGMVESYPEFQPSKADVQIAEPLPPVLANEAALIQCFSNLLGNAVKFVPPGRKPKVRVWAERRGEQVRFWFEDNGIGIAPEHHQQIFGMFQRLSKDFDGTGIGLALVRKTVTRMKGRVGLDSEPNRGSRFWVELQAAEVGPAPA